jgi:uncharacterized damage-inducible protein DinB
MTRKNLEQLVRSHDAVWDQWWPALAALPRASVRRRLGGSFPSVFATARHMLDAEIYWQDRLEGRRGESDAAIGATIGDLEAGWRGLQQRRLAWVRKVDPQRAVRFEASGGYLATVSVWQCFIHVVTHAHFHRGQLATQFRALGVPPPSRHLLGPFFGEF